LVTNLALSGVILGVSVSVGVGVDGDGDGDVERRR
jgi:hypothetical protein